MTRIAILIMLVGCALPGMAPAAKDRCAQAQCQAVKAKIRDIQGRMRSGYTRAQGERYAAKLRELRARRATLCR